MAIFIASTTAANLSLQDGAFTYWNAGLPSPNSMETPIFGTTTFIESDTLGTGIQAVWGGTGFTYATPTFGTSGGATVSRSELTGGTATSLTTLDGQNNTIFTLNGFSLVLSGTPRPTIADIFSGDDSITSGAGNDTLDAGSGNDTVSAGLGDDLIFGTLGADLLDGGAGTDTVSYLTGGAALSLTLNNTGGGTAIINAVNDTLVAIENIIGTNGFGDTIAGGSQANRFEGKGGNDSLVGGDGNDTLVGGAGIDTLNGGAGTGDWISFEEDFSQVIIDLTAGTHTVGGVAETHSNFEHVIGSLAHDSITGSAVANELQGGGGNDTLLGGDGDDILVGGTGVDSLLGGNGNDTLDGNAESYYQNTPDTLEGGLGNDYYKIEANYYYNVYDVVVENAGEGTDTVEVIASYYMNYGYTLAANVENLVVSNTTYYVTAVAGGNTLDNTITAKTSPYNPYLYYNYGTFKLYGGAGNDTIRGSHGNDTLNGGVGNDFMAGGRGNDVYYVNSAGDTVQERAGFGTDKIVTGISQTLTTNVEDGTLLGVSTAVNLTGNASNNVLRGNQFANKLDGLDGQDSLFGGAGNDTLLGGAGNDLINGGMGNDSLVGGDGTDTVDFSNLGVAITVNLATTGGQATGAGNDTLSGFENAMGGLWHDKITGTADSNVLSGNAGNDTLIGQAGIDILYGGAGNDNLQGGADTDTLFGDAGDDKLFGGAGSDAYTGGQGMDIFYFDVKEVSGFDTVGDFLSGEDKIAIDMSAFGGIGDGDTVIENAVMKYGAGGFAQAAELVIFTHGYTASSLSPSTADAAAAIGSATSAYAAGDNRLFVLDNGNYGHLYLFHSTNANALVEATELQLIGMLANAPDTVLGDYMFVA